MSDNRKALLLMAIAMASIAGNDAIMRWVGGGMPVGEMLVVRGVMFVCLMFACERMLLRRSFPLRALLHKWCVLRGLGELAATYLFLTSLTLIPIATATTLVFMSPIMLTASSRFIFGERVGPWRWGAVLAGFGGVMLVTGTGTDNWNPVMLMPLGAAVLVAARDTCTRMVAADVPSTAVSMTTGICVGAGGLLSLPWGWVPVSTIDVGWLGLAAIVIAISYYCYIVAVRVGELSLIAPIQYSVIIWATLFGWQIWAEIPDTRSLLGGAIIIASGLLILYRERVAQRRTESTATASS